MKLGEKRKKLKTKNSLMNNVKKNINKIKENSKKSRANITNNIEKTKQEKANIIITKIIAKIIKIFCIILVIYNILYIINYSANGKKYASIFGLINIATVKDNTMKKELNNNDLVITIKTNDKNLKVGDIIGYTIGTNTTFHRIEKITIENNKYYFLTKGANNYYYDIEEKTIEQVNGKVSLRIPIIGFIFKIFENYVMTIIIIIIFLLRLSYLNYLKKNSKKRKKEKEINKRQIKENNI